MSPQRVDALPGLAVPQLGREKHLEPEAGIKEMKSAPRRVSRPSSFQRSRVRTAVSEHVTYSRWNVIMKINAAVFVLITTHYAAGLEGQIIVRAVALMLFQGCICNECLLTPLFSFSLFLFGLPPSPSNPLFPLYPPPPPLFLSLRSFLTPVTSCDVQKITRLIIRHFIWQPANYVWTHSSEGRKKKWDSENNEWGKKNQMLLFVLKRTEMPEPFTLTS